MDINDRIKAIRIDSGLSQTAFAERLGTTRGVITNLEFKKTTPNDAFLGLICREFCVSQSKPVRARCFSRAAKMRSWP